MGLCPPPPLATVTGGLALLVALGTPLAGQEPPGETPRPAAGPELPPVAPPPALDPVEQARLQEDVDRLRNSNAERRAAAERDVIARGRAAIPALLEAAPTSHPGKQAGVLTCLLAVTDLRDRQLVADLFDDALPLLRRFAAAKAGEWDLPGLLDALPPLADDPDPEVATEAALALVSHGRDGFLGQLVDVYVGDDETTASWRPRILAALPGVAGRGDHHALVARLQVDPEREKEDPAGTAAERRAAVALLAALGDRAAAEGLFTALDDPHNLVQRDAIDALRALVEHKGPYEGRSTFQQIGEVQRLQALRGEALRSLRR